MAKGQGPHNGRVTAPHSQLPNGAIPQVIPPQPQVPDGPLPGTFSMEVRETPQGRFVWIRMENVGGSLRMWLSADDAENLATQIAQAAKAAKIGITIVGNMVAQALQDEGHGPSPA